MEPDYHGEADPDPTGARVGLPGESRRHVGAEPVRGAD